MRVLPVMSFVKAAFWILLILLLMPSNAEERYTLYTTAQRTVSDIGGFCRRNPDVCNKTSSIVDSVARKLQTTADTIEDMLRDAGVGVERTQRYDGGDRQRHGAYRPRSPINTTSSVSNDTLTPDDLRPAWRGPARF